MRRPLLSLAALAVLVAGEARAVCPDSGTSVADDFANIPVRNQASAAICNAEASAGVIDYWRCRRQREAGHPELCGGTNGMAGNATSAVSLFSSGFVAQWGPSGEKSSRGGMDSPSEVPGNDPALLFRSVLKTPPVAACSVDSFEETLGSLAALTGDTRSFSDGSLTEEDLMGRMALRDGNMSGTRDCSIQGLFKDWYDAHCGDFARRHGSEFGDLFFWEGDNTRMWGRVLTCYPGERFETERTRIRTMMEAVLPSCGTYASSDDAWAHLWPTMIDQTLRRGCRSSTLSAQMGTGLSVFDYRLPVHKDLQFAPDGRHLTRARITGPTSAELDRQNSAMRNALTGHVPVVLTLCYYNVFYADSLRVPQSQHCNGENADSFNDGMEEHPNPTPDDVKAVYQDSLQTGHAVVLLGSAEHGGRCQYKVRNSYGRNCGGHRQQCGECPPTSVEDPTPMLSCTEAQKYPNGCCDGEGNQWLDQSVLEMNVQSVSGYQPRGTAL